jgi:aminoglycoside 6'-N-acetyltransferase I
VQPGDRAEWLRLLAAFYPHHSEADHAVDVDAFLAGRPAGRPRLAAVFVSPRLEGGLAGFLELSVRDYAEGCAGPTPYVESWFVDPDQRGRGAGAGLVAAAERWARERGYRELASDTLLDNAASLRAHQALGFAEVERSIHLRKAL